MSNRCVTCDKPAYAQEQLIYDGKIYHKVGKCFACKECNCVLTPSNVAKVSGLIFCRPCFKKIFKEKGSYASFGPETLAKNAAVKDLNAAKRATGETSPTDDQTVQAEAQ